MDALPNNTCNAAFHWSMHTSGGVEKQMVTCRVDHAKERGVPFPEVFKREADIQALHRKAHLAAADIDRKYTASLLGVKCEYALCMRGTERERERERERESALCVLVRTDKGIWASSTRKLTRS